MGDATVVRAARESDRLLYRRLIGLAQPYTRQLVFLFLLDLLESVWVLLTPLPLKIVVDGVVNSRPLHPVLSHLLPTSIATSATALLIVAVTLLLVLSLLSSLQSLASSFFRGQVGEQLLLGFRGKLFLHAQRLSLTYHDLVGTSDTLYRINKDAGAVEDILIGTILPLAKAALTVALMFAVTLWLDWQLALVAALLAPVLLFLSGRHKRRLRRQSREVRHLESTAMAVIHEVFAVLRVVKAFGQEKREQERFQQKSRAGILARLRLRLAEGWYGMAIRLTIACGTAAVLFLGVMHVRNGTLTLGELLLVLAYSAQLYDPLKTLSRKAGGIQSHLASAERAFALLDQQPNVDDPPEPLPPRPAKGALRFENVSFGYEKDRPVLRDLSLEIEPGTRLGIVGATGAGKTTFLNLLLRFYDPDQGRVLLDGHDLKQHCLANLRNQYALVLQDAVLFSGRVADNIAYARPWASDEEIEAAARAAHAHEFIMRLPQGYDTLVGERGMTLSGGERQRIAIARAFLKDAPILLLDEPTSAVDIQTEAGILDAMEDLMRGRTSIIITHRLSPLSACDTVLVLEQGQLVTTSQAWVPGKREPIRSVSDGL